ncbi:BamA/TamA family outer membrane protein [Myxococcota bacterium]|nr:BamA/TamA family outer membrane protein [Myxococcota bacterium]
MAGAQTPVATSASKSLRAGAVALATLLALPFTLVFDADAAAPRREWRTIVTPRFRIHYHEGLAPLAAQVAADAEDALDTLVRLVGHHPHTPIHTILTDDTDAANGFAQIIPDNRMTLFAAVPEPFGALGDFDDFMRLLFVHELTHIVHLDAIGGVPRAVNDVLGKTLSPNQVQPRWFIEGIAVYAESRLTSGGRVRSAYVDLLVRAQLLADRFFTIDEITTETRRFPGGSVAWELGGRFLDFIARRHGEEALAEITREYGARLIPYGINVVARHATGKSYPELWDEWRDEETRALVALLERIQAEGGLRQGVQIPRAAEEVYAPRFAVDGRLATVEVPRGGDAAIVVHTPDLSRELLRVRTSRGPGAFTRDGRTFVASVFDSIDAAYSYGDLELVDVASGARRRRTVGARLDSPDVSRDGTIVAVQQAGGRTWLASLSVDGDDDPVPLVVPRPGEQISGPRWSPDGRSVVASLKTADGGRRITVFDVATRTRRDLTASRDQDLHPCFTPDGRRVVFTSDRGGVFDLFTVDVDTRRIERLTSVATGAFSPAVSPRGDAVVFVHGTAAGWELRAIPLGPPGSVALPISPSLPRRTTTSSTSLVAWPEAPYSPWESVLPKAWLPTTGVDGLGDTLGVLVTGDDAIGRHSYRATLEYGLQSRRVNYAFSYVNRRWWTPLFLSSSLVTTTRPPSFAGASPAEDRPVSIFAARLGFDVPFHRWDAAFGFGLSYGVETRTGRVEVTPDPFDDPPPLASRDLRLGSLTASWRFSTVRSFADSISQARGVALDTAIELHSPRIGSDLRLLSLTAHGTAYVTMPWLDHHVLALRTAFGASAGDARGRAVYVLGGLPIRNVLRDAVDGLRTGVDVIRGYDVAALRGLAFWLASAEYRVPLVRIERGIETLPIFFDEVNAAVFVDAGDAPFERLDLTRPPKLGLGAELKASVVAGYYQPLELKLGWARGTGELGIHNLYLVLGSSF